jgi:putative thioredoxin
MLLNKTRNVQDAPAGDLIKDTTTQGFRADVLDASRERPVLVDFWAPWCGPCKQLAPLLERAVRDARGKVALRKMNIDEHPGIPGQLGIRSIPAVIVFRNGQPVDGFVGALPESQIKAFLERVTANVVDDLDTLVQEAAQALAAGEVQAAADLYAAVLAEEAENVGALAGLVKVLVQTGDIGRAKELLARVPAAKANDPRVASARSSLDLAEQAAFLGDLAEVEARVGRNPDDHQARYDLAIGVNAKGRREAALDHLLEIVRRDRTWNEEAARKQLIELFNAWGPKDPLTLAGRRRLSSILFA